MARTEAANPSQHCPSGSSSRTRTAATLLGALVVLVPLLQAATLEARAATPDVILGRPRVGEYQPVRGENFLAWQQNTRRHPSDYNVYARPLDGTGRFRVNARGTNGANGEIEGDVLVYQQFKGRNSDLKFFNLTDRQRSSPPTGINTDQWEYWPSMSGDHLLFARLYGNGVRRIFLFDLTTGTSDRLGEVRGARAFLAPGEVSGDYAVWSSCRPSGVCDVIRYHIPDGVRETIANDGSRQHAPSVTPDGTVYFARSRADCGEGVQLMRQPLVGNATVLWRLSSGDDVGSTRTFVDPEGVTTLLFDQFDCEQAAGSDSWEIVEDFAPGLSVTLDGDASGTVTSSPPGINCGSDCTESYDAGTGVTLTATPEQGASFAGWSGACSGSAMTCTLTMNGSRSVTATFTKKPVLTVSKSGNGQGTVTSSPAGINCGGDCNEPYAQGTSVTLTADPAPDSTFGGWTGACGGSGLTCSVTMDANRSVTATFTLKQYTLTVTPTGAGKVTGDGIDCGTNTTNDCTEIYNSGTSVTLTAEPGSPVANAVQWGGDCSGTQLSCTLTMNGNKSVSATFTFI